MSDFKHFRINHPKEFANNHNHIKVQENFWSQSKRILRKNFHLFIKECEFRFNYGTPSEKLSVLRKWCDV